MCKYADVQGMLDAAIGGDEIGAHGAFWRTLTRDQFVAKKVYGYPVVTLGEGNNSNLVLALRGQAPFGQDIDTPDATMPRMPVGYDPMPADQIDAIAEWITANCPE